MNWLNLEVSTIRAAEYVGSEPIQRATWLNVLAYSAEHENGGRIAGARKWKDRQWQQTCGVTIAEVEAASHLLTWDGNDLIVWRYPADKEAEVKARREYGRIGGIKSGEARREAPVKAPAEAHLQGELEGELEAKTDLASTEGKGREGKEKGINTGSLSTRETPTLEAVIAGGLQAGVQPNVSEQFWLGCDSRPLAASGKWTNPDGSEMRTWQSALKKFSNSWVSNDAQRAQKHGRPASTPKKPYEKF